MTIRIICIIFFILLIPSPTHAQINIEKIEEDVTNDGLKDTLTLHGTYLTEQSTFFKDVSLSIHNHFDKKWHIILKEGYDPTIVVENITNNKKQNIFYAVALNKERTIHYYDLYEFDGQVFKKIPLPALNHIEAEFSNAFQVTVKNKFNQQKWKFNIAEKRKSYIEAKLYEDNGTLKKRQKLQISPIYEARPILLSASKGYGLETKRYIVGIDEKDIIATINTTFYYKNGKWTIVSESVSSI